MFTVGSMFNNLSNNMNNLDSGSNIMNQLKQCQQDKGAILDILLQNGKINQQEYNDLQQYKNNPQQIVQYLAGRNQIYANQINQIVQGLNQK